MISVIDLLFRFLLLKFGFVFLKGRPVVIKNGLGWYFCFPIWKDRRRLASILSLFLYNFRRRRFF